MDDALPHIPSLGKLEYIEVYEYYDKPLLFACRNNIDQIFIAVLADEGLSEDDENDENDPNYEQWIYVGVSHSRFARIRSGAIDLYDTFKKSEQGTVFVVTIEDSSNKQQVQVQTIPVSALSEDQVPAPGNYIQIQQDTETLSFFEPVLLESV